MMIKEPEQRIPLILEMLFPQDWLDSKSLNDPQGRTNREIETEVISSSYALLESNVLNLNDVLQGYRSRIAVTRPQTPLGSVSQMAAAMTHRVSPDRLRQISSIIPKVLIVTGTTDNLVDPANSHFLKEHMPEAELIVKEGAGHGITMQYRDWLNELLEKTFNDSRERATRWP